MSAPQTSGQWRLRFGSRVLPAGGVEFRLWAPQLRQAAVSILGEAPRTVLMKAEAEGEFAVVAEAVPGQDYMYVLEGARRRPDPVSRWQPDGVHGPSRIVDPNAFQWADGDWAGLPLKDYILYELHTGTFSPAGTFEGIIPRLPYLRELGITAVELMPVAEFPGRRNWGYDGVCLYAPQSTYGGPAGLKTLVDACHREGLAVVLDVVYNHLGPEGNYLGEFAPYFTDAYRTPWGRALNFDGPGSDGVRRFFIDNALYWLTEYHVDALRLDAIHGIFDFSARHFLEELTESFHRQAAQLGRLAWVIAESDLNDVRIVNPRSVGGYGVDAQWLDDFHHSLRTVLTGENRGYLADFGTLQDLRKAICEGFVYDGRYSRYRRRRHGSSSKGRPGRQFVAFIQNHDQIANASQGKRLSGLVSIEQQKLAAAVLLCSPYLPLLFMGQEYGETAPFLYFTSFDDPGIGEAVREGRRREFAAFQAGGEFADPQAPETFARSRLDWTLAEKPPHQALLRFHRDLLALRRRHACLSNCRKHLTRVEFHEQAKWLLMERADPSGSRILLAANFSPSPQTVPVPFDETFWELALWSGAPLYGGGQAGPAPPAVLRKDRMIPVELPLAGFGAALYAAVQAAQARPVPARREAA